MALLLATLLAAPHARPDEQLGGDSTRRLEARPSGPVAEHHRPHVPHQAAPRPLPLRELARLEQQGNWRALATSFLLREDAAQAVAFLSREPPSPARDNDLAIVALLQGRYDEALERLDDILAAHPAHAQALWNQGLVLRELELPLLAAATFDAVAALGEPGWSEEAQTRAAALREPQLQREREWKAARGAVRALVETAQAPLPLEVVERFPSVARQGFYDAVRAAPSRERALALLPLAEALDHRTGGTVLRDYVHRVAARDFGRREPLARGYALLLRHQHPTPERFIEQLVSSGEEDIALGALVHTRKTLQYLVPFLAFARASGDPWLELGAKREQARQEKREGSAKAEPHLLALRLTCEEKAMPALCLEVERSLVSFYTDANRLPEATEHARNGLRLAQQLGEWELERFLLQDMAQIARFRVNPAVGRAFLEESLLRGPEDCRELNYVHRNLARFAFMEFRVELARREMDKAMACGLPVGLHGAWILGELSRLAPRPGDEQLLRVSLEEQIRTGLPPGLRLLAGFIEGRFTIEHDRQAGQALLREVVREAARRPRTDVNARDARAGAYATLVVDAGRNNHFEEVLALTAESLQVPEPTRCALAVAVDAERTVVVTRGPSGEQRAYFDASRRTRLGSEVSHLAPAPMVEMLRGCERVEVLALPPIDSSPGLLPPDIAWSYRAPRPAPRLQRPPPLLHLVVSDVEAPSHLRLARLPAWASSPDAPGPRLLLSGTEATPSRVLKAMASATEIEIHAHSVVDPELSIASLIVLAPEGDGRYALTAEDVRSSTLAGEPVVLLAACGAARITPFLHESFTLPKALIAAGARAVFASAVDIPDSAGRFFSAVRERIRAGAPPALALRDERQQWLLSFPEARWVNDVLLYE